MIERPKVYFNEKTKTYVMYAHIDGKGEYRYASVAVLTSDRVDGAYQYRRSFRPLGHESRDIGQFIDDDGAAYLIFEDRPFGFRIARLAEDYLDVEKEICLIPLHLEGGAVVHSQGLYYAIGSALTGWDPNPDKYTTATSLAGHGPKSRTSLRPRRALTARNSMMVKVVGSKQTTVIFTGDIWKPRSQWDSRYLWMPLEIGDGKLHLPAPRPWTLDVETGKTAIQ